MISAIQSDRRAEMLACRIKLGLSQHKFAAAIGVSRSTISGMEGGTRFVNKVMIMAIRYHDMTHDHCQR